jgi:hypothetical protein
MTLYHAAVRYEGLGVPNTWRTTPASMCSVNSAIWRRWHYSVRVFFVEWIWPSRNTARKSKHGRIQGHFDPLRTVYSRRSVRWWPLSVSAWQCSLPQSKVCEGLVCGQYGSRNGLRGPESWPESYRKPVGWIRTPTWLQTPTPPITYCSGYRSAGRMVCHSDGDVQTPDGKIELS